MGILIMLRINGTIARPAIPLIVLHVPHSIPRLAITIEMMPITFGQADFLTGGE